MKKTITTIIMSLFLLYGNYSFTQEIETLWGIEVTTASKSAEKISDAPGIVSVVTKEEITNFGSTSLSDILNRLTSMYMIHAGTFTWNVASIRGQNVSSFDTHTLVLVNGRPMRDGVTGGMNSVFYNAFPVEGIERIEVIRGPGSVLYGSNAYAGIINIITTKAEKETHFQTSIMAGSFGTKNINFGGGVYVNEDLNINLGGRWYDDEGSDFGGVAGLDKTEKKSWTKDNKSVFLNLNYKSLTINGGYAEMNPFALVSPLKWENEHSLDSNIYKYTAGDEVKLLKHTFVDVGYSHNFNDNYSLSTNLTLNRRVWMGDENITDAQHPNGNQLSLTKADSKNILAEVTFHGSPRENLNFVFGGTFDFNLFDGENFGRNPDGSLFVDELMMASSYLQIDYTVFDKLKFILGSQVNVPIGSDPNISPRAGIIYNANDHLGFKALYSTAFRSPYPQEKDVQHFSYFGNEDLKPELIATTEIQAFFQNEKIFTSLTAYKSHLSDLIKIQSVSDTLGFYEGQAVQRTYKNIGIFDFMGIEFEGKYNINSKLTAFANFTYQVNEGDLDDDETIKDAAIWPNTMAKIGLMYSCETFSAGVYNSYFGKPTAVVDILDAEGVSPDSPDYTQSLNPEATAYNLLSLNINLHLFKLFNVNSDKELTFGIYGDNLLDESIWFPEFESYRLNTLPLHTGRAIYGKIAFKF